MDLAHFVGNASIEKHSLGGRGFTSVHMSHDAYIAIAIYRRRAGHRKYCCWWSKYCLVAVVGKSLVCIGHAVRIFALLHGATAAIGCVHQFSSEPSCHGLLTA